MATAMATAMAMAMATEKKNKKYLYNTDNYKKKEEKNINNIYSPNFNSSKLSD